MLVVIAAADTDSFHAVTRNNASGNCQKHNTQRKIQTAETCACAIDSSESRSVRVNVSRSIRARVSPPFPDNVQVLGVRQLSNGRLKRLANVRLEALQLQQ